MLAAFWCVLLAPLGVAAAEKPNPQALGEAYRSEIRPLVERYCHDCHGAADTVEADINLAAMKTWDDVDQAPADMAKSRRDARQRPDAAAGCRAAHGRRAGASCKSGLASIWHWSRENDAGDPGRVVLRRLSNAEYTYTLRDLTGVESLDPARVSGRWRGGRRLHEHRQRAGDVAGAGHEVSRRGEGSREPRGAVAGWFSLFAPHDGPRLDRRHARANPRASTASSPIRVAAVR